MSADDQDRDERTNEEWRDDLEAWLKRVEKTQRKRYMWLLRVVLVGLVVYGVMFTVVFARSQGVADRIQFERAYYTWVACDDLNTRNEDTHVKLDKTTPPGPIRDLAGSLIDALAPHRDSCIAAVVAPRFSDDITRRVAQQARKRP